jgi:dihydroorotase
VHRLLIRNARVARPDASLHEVDVLCRAGRIERIAPSISEPADEILDGQGRHVLLPGVIDPQVHFREPGAEHKEDLGSGSRAAVRGGVTSFLEMPNTRPPTTTQAALDDKLERAAQKCVANYGFFIGATPDNLADINTAAPVCGIKIFMGSSTGTLLVNRDEDLERIFANGSRLIAVHAEDEERIRVRQERFAGRIEPETHSMIRDNECALIATAKALELSRRYRRRLHVLHMSTHEEADLLRAGKPDWVTAEAIPNHLFLNTGDYADQGTLVQMNPPIRAAADNDALWQALRDGVIDIIATDHAPHTLEEKRAGFPDAPSGMPGVETSLPLMLTAMRAGRCTLAEILTWMCEGPARVYRIPNKGRIEEGWDADLALVDLEGYRPVRNEEVFSRAGWSPYAGRELTGWPTHTIVGGRIVYERGTIRDGVLGSPLTFASD